MESYNLIICLRVTNWNVFKSGRSKSSNARQVFEFTVSMSERRGKRQFTGGRLGLRCYDTRYQYRQMAVDDFRVECENVDLNGQN
jgi:hypothetical protein